MFLQYFVHPLIWLVLGLMFVLIKSVSMLEQHYDPALAMSAKERHNLK